MRIEKILVVGDAQAPYYHEPSLKIVKQFAADWQPTVLVDLGDRGDLRSLSGFEEEGERGDLRLNFVKDRQAGEKWGDRLHESLPSKCRKVFLKGNHEERCRRKIAKDIALKDLVEIDNYLIKNGYTVVEHKQYHKLGKLLFHHGDDYGGVHHAKQYALKTGKNVMYGHYHEFQCYTVHHIDQPHMAQSIGMMGDREKLSFYMHGRPSNWQNGFAYVYMLPDGSFNHYPVVITNNKAVIEGRVYRG